MVRAKRFIPLSLSVEMTRATSSCAFWRDLANFSALMLAMLFVHLRVYGELRPPLEPPRQSAGILPLGAAVRRQRTSQDRDLDVLESLAHDGRLLEAVAELEAK